LLWLVAHRFHGAAIQAVATTKHRGDEERNGQPNMQGVLLDRHLFVSVKQKSEEYQLNVL
jgi:hypothetical protein